MDRTSHPKFTPKRQVIPALVDQYSWDVRVPPTEDNHHVYTRCGNIRQGLPLEDWPRVDHDPNPPHAERLPDPNKNLYR